MAEDVARLVAIVEANLKGFTKGMADMNRIADQRFGALEKRMKQSESRFANFGRNLSRGLLGFLSVAGITRFVSSINEAVGKIQDTSDALGISTDSLQTWGIVAGRAGVRQEELNKALGSFTQRLGEAQIKGGPFAKFLDGIGVGTKGNPEQVLMRIADAVKATASQQQKAAIVGEALGARYVRLVPLFEQGADGLARLNAEFVKNGQIIGRETVAKIDELGDKWEDLKKQFTVIGANVLGGLAEEFSGFTAQLTDPAFQAALRDFGKILADAAIAVAKVAGGIGSVASALGLVPAGDEIQQLQALIAEQKKILADRGGNVGPIFLDNLAAAEKKLNELLRKKAELAGLGPTFSIPTGAPTGGIDRTGQLEENTEAEKRAKQEAELWLDSLNKVSEVIDDIVKKDREFRQAQGEAAQELRNKGGGINGMTSEDLDALDDFHREAKERWDDFWQRQAEKSQEAHDILKEDVADSILFLGEAALEGGEAFERAFRQMIIQATLLAIKMNVLKPLLDWALGGAPGAGILGGLIQGRASGGPVNAGQLYRVNENNTEWFRPSTSGTVLPIAPPSAMAAKSTSSMILNMPIDARGAQEGVAEQIARVAPAIVAAAVKQVNRNFGSMMIKTQRDQL